jgi:hypothetical protein
MNSGALSGCGIALLGRDWAASNHYSIHHCSSCRRPDHGREALSSFDPEEWCRDREEWCRDREVWIRAKAKSIRDMEVSIRAKAKSIQSSHHAKAVCFRRQGQHQCLDWS